MPITVHIPFTIDGFSVSTKLRKLGFTVVEVTLAAGMGLLAIAVTSGPGSLMLCLG